MPFLSVVICAYTERRWNDLREAVASVEAQGQAVGQLVIVIDHNEVLLERARDAWSPRHVVIANSRPTGLSGARNTGVALATGEVVAFLDDDASAVDGWARGLAAHYVDQRVMGVGGAAQPVWPTGRAPSWFPDEFGWVVGCSYRGQPVLAAPVRNMIGANMSPRRSVFHLCGFLP